MDGMVHVAYEKALAATAREIRLHEATEWMKG
jgi:hypothetical protein